MDDELPLRGRRVGITADRRWEEQAELFRRRGAEVVHGPTMQTLDLSADERLRAVTDELVARPPDWLVVTTGVGVRSWLDAADGWGRRPALLAALGAARVVARGAKSSSAVRGAGLEVAWRAPDETMDEVVEHLAATDGVAGSRVALQLFDPDGHPSTAAIRQLVGDGELVEVPLYRWLLPADRAPALALVDGAVGGRLDAVTFTSQPAVRFLFRIAAEAGCADALRDALNGPVLPVCVGPVCARALVEEGVERPRWPEPNRLPPMVRLVADQLGAPTG